MGSFLRSRRERVDPVSVGLPDTRRRRTPGLRREEVAALAGISADYYLRLEQGRGGTPSGQVVDALVRALRLGADERQYLESLLRPPAEALEPTREMLEEVQSLLDAFDGLPAFAQSLVMDVLVSNAAARALSPHLVPGKNLLLSAFLDPHDRSTYEDWPAVAADAVGHLRVLARPVAGTKRFQSLVRELQERSPEFSELWKRQDVVPQASGSRHIRHPVQGDMHLRFSKLDLPGSVGVQIVIYRAEHGTQSADRLRALGEMGDRGFPG